MKRKRERTKKRVNGKIQAELAGPSTLYENDERWLDILLTSDRG
jgi:hypothetical protein